jgi:protocatechuate 3,4-dioxygenase beta subunit
VTVYAQAPPTAAIEGRVYNAQTGDPVRKAQVLVRHWGGRRGQGAYGATTDAAGRFSIDGIEPGVYGISASRNGYNSGRYGQKRPTGRGAPLTLAKGQRVRNADVRLVPQAVVSGAVLDDDNEGIAGVEVMLVSQRFDDGRRVLYGAESAETDDRGMYRIAGVAPGRYYLAAVYHGEYHDQQSEVLNAKLGSYAPVYYPDSIGGPGAATQLTATPAAEIAGMDFHLRRVHLARISGRLGNAPRAGNQPVTVLLMPQDATELSWAMNREQAVDEHGGFVFHDCAPGEYTLLAQFFAGRQQLTAMKFLTVSNSDIDGVSLNLMHLPDVAGQVRLEGLDAKALAGMGVYLAPVIPQGSAPVPQGMVSADGSFNLSAVGPNRFRVIVSPLPEDAYVRAMRAGGAEVADHVLDFRKGAPTEVTIILSGNGAQVSGKVRSLDAPAAGVTVLLAPNARERFDLYKSEITDQNGAFTLKGIPPGSYKLFAFDDLDAGAWQDPDFLPAYEKSAQPIEFHEGDRLTKDLDAIPAAP